MEIPINSSAKLTSILKNGTANTILYSQDYSRSSFLLLKDGGSYQAYVMTVIADPAYLKNDLTKLDHNKYSKRDSDFTGAVLYSTPKGEFISGWFYNNGDIVNTLQPSNATGKDTVKNNELSVQNLHPNLAQVNCTDWYQVSEVDGTVVDVKYLGPICDYSGGNGTGPGAPPGAPAPGGGGNPAAPPKTDCTVPNSVKVKIQSTDGHLIVNKKDGGPITIGDGDGTFPPPTTTPPPKPVPCPTVYVINNVNDPCLKNMVKATISAGVTSQVNTLVQGVFGNSDKLNLTFVDVDTLKNYVDGQTKPNGFFDANGKLNITVLLNKNTMPHFSQQYVARVIMHEALHAYMIAKKIPPVEQHEDMAISYVTKMASSLQQLFPGLSDADAKNLSLGGLTQTTTFQNTIAKDMGLSGSFDATQSSYSIGSSGLRCN